MMPRILAPIVGLAARFARARAGATAIEYGLIASMIAVFLMAISGLGTTLRDNFYDPAAAAMTRVSPGGGEPVEEDED